MGHYDCKSCHASPGEEHATDCERFPPMTDTKPVAWMFSHKTDNEVFVALNKARMDPRYWTETPLYASPQPCTDCDALREEVERLRGVLDKAREAERAAIVAWLRESAAWHDKHDDGLSGFDGIRQGQTEAADAIEAGEHHD